MISECCITRNTTFFFPPTCSFFGSYYRWWRVMKKVLTLQMSWPFCLFLQLLGAKIFFFFFLKFTDQGLSFHLNPSNKATTSLFFLSVVRGCGWHRTHMHHTHCNYRGILNTGLPQLTENIKARARAEWLVPEHGRFTYPPHTHSKMITELPLPQTREQRQANMLEGGVMRRRGSPSLLL